MVWNFPTIAALCIFAATYLLISLQKIRFLNLDRPSAALLGAVAMVAVGAISMEGAFKQVNLDTLLLLLGMMVIVAYLKLAGFFEWISTWMLIRAGTPQRLLWLVIFTSGGLSALFVNDTICILFTPILLGAVLRANLNPAPYLIALVTSANIGSAATLTGNPQNMLVGIASHIAYGKFFLVMAPIALIGLVIAGLLISLLYRGRLGEHFAAGGWVLPALDRALIGRVLGVLGVVLVLFLLPLHRWMAGVEVGKNLPFAAAVGAVLVILVGKHAPARALAHVDWPLLLFFAGLFVVVAGVRETKLLTAMYEGTRPLFGSTDVSQASVMTGFSIVMSNVVSNVPFVAVVPAWMGGFASKELMWAVVAMSSTFAGNLTIVGSVANMIVMELSKDRARVGFVEYLKVGVPLTLLTSAVGLGLLLAAHAVGFL
jgi:Na+/H+ antiporter NhaD/arsenite permease-like protein